jgi:hypothetical protein
MQHTNVKQPTPGQIKNALLPNNEQVYPLDELIGKAV